MSETPQQALEQMRREIGEVVEEPVLDTPEPEPAVEQAEPRPAPDDDSAALDELLEAVAEPEADKEPDEVAELRAELEKTRRRADKLAREKGFLLEADRLRDRHGDEPAPADSGPLGLDQYHALAAQQYEDFTRQYRDVKDPEMDKAMTEELWRHRGQLEVARESGNQAFMKYAIANALMASRDAALGRVVTERRRVEQFDSARQAKLRAGSVQSAPAAARPASPRSLAEMSQAELAAELDRLVPPPRPVRRR